MQVTPSLARLTSEDFVLDDVLSIIYTKCTIVLFHSDCAKSAKMGRVFAEVAESSAGAQFGCVNIQAQKVILDAIVSNSFGQDHQEYHRISRWHWEAEDHLLVDRLIRSCL